MTVKDLLERARSQIGQGIRYKMGGGTAKASRHTCADANKNCDCSSFVCWALGIDKNGDYPYLRPPGSKPEPGGDWYGTDQIWDDAVNLGLGLFQKIATPVAGCVVVFPTTWQAGKAKPAGHCGIVSAVGPGGVVTQVLHCSSGNFKAKGDAVEETDPHVFLNPKAIFAWCARIEAPLVKGAVANLGLHAAAVATGQVQFIVVATGADEAAITAAAQEIAGENPIGRRVVKRGDPDFPSDAQIAQQTAGTANPGAVVLRRNGTLFEVLDVEDAQNPAAITEVFTHAFGGGA
jgi:hypothetical protein